MKLLTEEQEKIWRQWEEDYIPDCGKADTIAGEIIRAFQRLEYRWYNDGDKVNVGYGNETCNSSDRYLHKKVPGYTTPRGGDKTYEHSLYIQMSKIFNYLQSKPELFELKNNVDSRERSASDMHW